MDKKKIFTPGDPQESAARVEKKKHSKLWFILLVVAVLATVTLSLLWDQSTFDGLRRSVIYAAAQKDESGCAALYHYTGDQVGDFAVLDGSLVKLCANELTEYSDTNQTIVSESIRFTSPVLVTNGSCAAAYDVGGEKLYILDAKGILWEREGEGAILSVTITADNYVTVIGDKSGYKAAVVVYTPAGEPMFEFRSGDRFVMTGCLSPDHTTLAAITMGQEKNRFTSYLVLYRTNSETPVCTVPVTDGTVYDVGWVDGCFCIVGERGLYFYDTVGEKVGSYVFGSNYLRRCSLSGDGYAAVLLSRYRAGSQSVLVTVDSEGNELGTVEQEGEVLSLHSAGRYTAVLLGDSLHIYSRQLEQEAELPDISEAHQVLMRSDGSAVLAGASEARLYLP